MKRASIKDVAREAGVSVGTVSNVLNHPETVTGATRDRVAAVITELGYVRNESARQLRVGHSRTLGLVVLDIANPFFTDVARGVEAAADDVGSLVTVCNSGDSIARERRHLEVLLEQRVQGLLITPVDERNVHVARLVEQGIPVVLLDRGAGRHRLCSVSVNDLVGGRLAVAHLIERGHHRIAFVGGPSSIRQVADRRRGALDAVAEAGGDHENLVVIETPSLTVAGGQLAGEKVATMPAPERPTAVFCANDLLALGVLQEMTRHDVAVPADVAIVGYDDVLYAAAAAVPLSSVRQPREELGRAAAQLLFEEIAEPEAHRHRQVVFEPELVVRESSAPARNPRNLPA